MKIVDARSGQEFTVNGKMIFDPPKVIDYGDGDKIAIHAIEPGLQRTRANVTVTYDGFVLTSGWVPLKVRWLHPGWFAQHVAFLPG